MSLIPWLISAALAFLLGGCNLAPGYAEYLAAAKAIKNEGIIEYQQFHDDARAAWVQAGCQITVGSLSRETNATVRAFIINNPTCPNNQRIDPVATGGAGAATSMVRQ